MIPRGYTWELKQVRDVQLHVFADASTQTMAAMAYLRLGGDYGTSTTLVIAETRVSLIKILTVPRM